MKTQNLNQRLKAIISPVEFAQRFVDFPITTRGGELKGPCPQQPDSQDTLIVNEKFWNCRRCNVGGPAEDYVSFASHAWGMDSSHNLQEVMSHLTHEFNLSQGGAASAQSKSVHVKNGSAPRSKYRQELRTDFNHPLNRFHYYPGNAVEPPQSRRLLRKHIVMQVADRSGKVIDKPGSSVPLAVIGVFLLWLGWFGFNGGSVLSADPDAVSYVLVTTSLAACTGGLFGFLTAYLVFKRMDLGMVLNGILAGLVGITAGADVVSINAALFIGALAGILVVLSAITLDKFKLDDVVGAVSVHLTCGIWGTLAVGIFSSNADHTFMTQTV